MAAVALYFDALEPCSNQQGALNHGVFVTGMIDTKSPHRRRGDVQRADF